MEGSARFAAHSGYVLSLLYTRDSSLLLSSGMDKLVKVWSVPGWKLKQTLDGNAHSVNCMSLSPDEALLAAASTDNSVKL